MIWFVVVPVGWTVLALVVGLFVGRGIRMAGGTRPECPLPTGIVTSPRAFAPPAPGATTEPAAADLPATAAGVGHATERRTVTVYRPVRQPSLTAAR